MEEPLANVPKPSPHLDGPQYTPSLTLTPERPSDKSHVTSSGETTLSSVGTLGYLSRGSVEAVHRLAHPSVNSSRKLELRLAALDKENITGCSGTQRTLDPVRPSEEDVTKVVSLDPSVQVYRDLVSVDVSPTDHHHPEKMRGRRKAKMTGQKKEETEEPNILEFFSKDDLTEEATWEFNMPEEVLPVPFATFEQFDQKRKHFWTLS